MEKDIVKKSPLTEGFYFVRPLKFSIDIWEDVSYSERVICGRIFL